MTCSLLLDPAMVSVRELPLFYSLRFEGMETDSSYLP